MPERSTVAVFGDPHMLIYGAEDGEFVTCAAEGDDIVYLKNAFMEITGKNEAAFSGSEATYMTAVSFVFVLSYRFWWENTLVMQS